MKTVFAAAALLLSQGDAAVHTAKRATRAVPAKQDLSPTLKSDDFHKDFTHDVQPRASKNLKFDHPYPEVQEPDTFDQDYPKDENHDAGEWHAQMDYDNARNLLTKKEDAERRAQKAKEALDRQLEHARRALAHAEAEARWAESDVKDAKKGQAGRGGKGGSGGSGGGSGYDEDDDEDAGNDASAALGAEGSTAKSVDELIEEVQYRTNNLPDCQEQLSKANEKLKKLMEGREEHELDHIHEIVEAKNDLWRAEKAYRKAQEHHDKLVERQNGVKEALAQQEEKHGLLQQDWEAKAALGRHAQEDYEESRERLRKYRKVPEDLGLQPNQDEAVYEEGQAEGHHGEHSGAPRWSTTLASSVLAPFVALLAFHA